MSPGISRLWLWRSQKHWKYDSIQSGENLSVNDDGDRNNGNALFYDDGGWASILEYDEVKRAKIQPLDFWFENNKALVIITFPNF